LPAVPAIMVELEGTYNKFCGTVVVTTISCLQEKINEMTNKTETILFMKLYFKGR
jgi:hypothetical protein